MKKSARIFLILIFLFVFGCAAAKDYRALCEKYGFTPATVKFAECIQKEVLADRAMINAADAAMDAAIIGGYLSRPRPAPRIIVPSY